MTFALGDNVLYYTHEASDLDQRSNDELAFVIRVVDEDTYDLVVFPSGGPLRWVRAYVYNSEAPFYRAGGSYIRGVDEDPPAFDELYHSNQPEWVELRRKQQAELDAPNPKESPEDRAKRHKQEQDDLDADLDERFPRKEVKDA